MPTKDVIVPIKCQMLCYRCSHKLPEALSPQPLTSNVLPVCVTTEAGSSDTMLPVALSRAQENARLFSRDVWCTQELPCCVAQRNHSRTLLDLSARYVSHSLTVHNVMVLLCRQETPTWQRDRTFHSVSKIVVRLFASPRISKSFKNS